MFSPKGKCLVELSHYASILQRRWRLIAAIATLSLLAAAIAAWRGPCAYQASMRMAVSVVPEPRRDTYYSYDNYYPWLASEYLADDLSELLRSQALANDVSAELLNGVDPGFLASATRTKKTHRMLDITICGSEPAVTMSIADAYERVINSRLGEYMGMLQANNGYARIINRPTLTRASGPAALIGEVLLRTAVGSVLAIGLAFLLEYLDDRLRTRREIEALLDWPVLGEIPAQRA
jgi:capsular polysaccharide biosynthesis protein